MTRGYVSTIRKEGEKIVSIKGNNSLMPNNHEGFLSRVGHCIKHWWDGLSPEVKAIVCAGGVMVVNNAVNGFL